MGKDNRIEKHINPEDLPDFFRKIAAALENGTTQDTAYLAGIEGFKKLKLDIRNEYGQTSIKIKAKPSKSGTMVIREGAEDEFIQAKPKYSNLKKRMKISFKTIFKALHAGTLPPAEAVEEFVADSHIMIGFTDKGYGDEYYEEYINACEAFKKAFDEGNVEQAHKLCDEINSIKAHCHSKYD